jgi:tryptophanase
LYRHAGVRSVEIGSVMFGDAARQELLRLPSRAASTTRARWIICLEAILEVNGAKARILGFEIVSEPQFLRHFTACFGSV